MKRQRTRAVTRKRDQGRSAYIFMPFMAPPIAPPFPDAPTPSTLNSTAIGPACSKLSVALTMSPFASG